jgi:rubrerythrin
MTDVEMLRLASGEEDKAIKLYQGMLTDHPHLKDILLILITEEQKHKKLIEKKISELIRF